MKQCIETNDIIHDARLTCHNSEFTGRYDEADKNRANANKPSEVNDNEEGVPDLFLVYYMDKLKLSV